MSVHELCTFKEFFKLLFIFISAFVSKLVINKTFPLPYTELPHSSGWWGSQIGIFENPGWAAPGNWRYKMEAYLCIRFLGEEWKI